MILLPHIINQYKAYGYIISDTDDVDIKIGWKLDSDVAVIFCNSLSNKFVSAGIIEKVKTLATNRFLISPKKHTLVIVVADNSRIKHEMKVAGAVFIDANTEKVYRKKLCVQAKAEIEILDEAIAIQKNKKYRSESLKGITHSKVFKNYHLTYLIMAVCILCYFLVDNQNQYGICYNTVIQNGKWQNLIVYMFLHGSITHLFYNMLSIYYIGRMLEKTYGTYCMLFILFTGSIYGAFASIYGFCTDIPTVGLSGGLFALIGASLVVNYKDKKNMRVVILNLLFTTLMQTLNPFDKTDYLCHIGGFLAGIAFMLSFVLLRKTINNIEYSRETRILNQKNQLKSGF